MCVGHQLTQINLKEDMKNLILFNGMILSPQSVPHIVPHFIQCARENKIVDTKI